MKTRTKKLTRLYTMDEILAALSEVSDRLENWMEIAERDDVRRADSVALNRARRIIATLGDGKGGK